MACGFWVTCLTGGLEAWSKTCEAAGDGAASKQNPPPACPRRREEHAAPARS